MKTIQEKTEEILAITDPNKAYFALAMDDEIPLDEMEKILDQYMEKYNVTQAEMAFYPNGEQVLAKEMFMY